MAIDLNLFSTEGQLVVNEAQRIVKDYNQNKIDPEHLLLALLEIKSDTIRELFRALGVRHSEFKTFLYNLLPKLSVATETGNNVFVSVESEEIINNAISEQKDLKDININPYHILIAIAEAKQRQIATLLRVRGIVKPRILEYLKGFNKSYLEPEKQSTSQDPNIDKAEFNILGEYCVDLIKMAREKRFDPVIGRDEEIRNVIQILSRRSKNNPVLVGDPGVGKTAIIEGLAQKIFEGDVPETLKNVSLLMLDIASLLAGTKYRGDFEERMKSILKSITNQKGQFILFIDELHNIVGTGSSEGAMDISNMLKPSLARGELRCIGATTFIEYKKHIEKDLALARRFQTIIVDEPNTETATSIMRGLKEKYEVHHGVRIKDSAIIMAVNLSKRYINNRFLPDKAIDLVDEAASKVRIEIDSMPAELEKMTHKIFQMEIELTALTKENDSASTDKVKLLQKDIKNTKQKYDDLRQEWEEEKTSIHKIRILKEEIEHIKQQELEAQKNGDLETAANLKYGKLAQLEKDFQQLSLDMDQPKTKRILKEEVDEEDIGAVVSKWTKIPLSKMMQSEKDKLLNMELSLSEKIVGQYDAIAAVSNSIRRGRAGIQDPNRPLGSFIFLGPTGVGKTELAKTLAEFLFDDRKSIIRLDMSEYSEKHSVSKMIGAPPGYVGYDMGGTLTEQIRRKPYSVILLDEIEKAHPEIFNLFLQVLDDGYLTDSQGFRIDFRNSLIVMTTNLGADIVLEESIQNKNLSPQQLRKIMLTKLSPEMLNRIDEIVVFKALSSEQIRQIFDLHIKLLAERLLDKNIVFKYTKDVETLLSNKSFDKEFGARPLQRVLQKEIQDLLALKILDGTVKSGSTVEARVTMGKLSLHLIS